MIKKNVKENSQFKFGKIPALIAVFFCIIVLSSATIGFFTLSPWVIIPISIVITITLYRLIPSTSISKTIFLLIFLLVVLLAYPVLLLTHSPSSADAATTTAVRAIGEKVPFDYGEYGSLNMSYQIGFPLIVKQFTSIFTIEKDYLISWALALICGALQLFFLYLLASELFKSEKAGLLAAGLLFTSKLIFENLYVGEFSWILATGLMLFFFWLYLKKSALQYVVFPPIFVIHPAVGISCGVMLFAHMITNTAEKRQVLFAYASRLVVVPIVLINYTLPVAYNALFNQKVFFHEFSFNSLPSTILAIPFWIGTGLSIIFGVVLIASVIKKKKIVFDKFLWTTLALSFTIFLFAAAIGTFSITSLLAGRIIELVALSLILITTGLLMKLKIRHSNLILAGIIIVGLIFFFNSSILTHYREGSKISFAGTEFADKFYEFDKDAKKTLFLTEGSGKLAEFSNKVPFNLAEAHAVFSYDFSFYPNEGFNEYKNNSNIWKKIYYEKQIDLIKDLNVYYIVTDENYFKDRLNYPIVFNYKEFRVYKKN